MVDCILTPSPHETERYKYRQKITCDDIEPSVLVSQISIPSILTNAPSHSSLFNYCRVAPDCGVEGFDVMLLEFHIIMYIIYIKLLFTMDTHVKMSAWNRCGII